MAMDTVGIENNRGVQARGPHAHAAIVFGSAVADPGAKRASVRATCEAIGLPRSTYYYQSHRSAPAIELEHKIVLRLHELRESFPNDGYRRMTQQLQREGFQINRKRIARLMQLHGLTLRSSKGSSGITTRQGQTSSPVANLWQSVRLTRPHQVWVADIAYVRIRSGLVYAAAIIDAWSREVVGYAVSAQINPRLASIALHAAVRAHRPAPGSVHHSSSGAQYVMRGYTELLRQYGLIPSAGDTGDRSALPSLGQAATAPPRQVVQMQMYETWEHIIGDVREFIRTLYVPERIDRVLGRQTAETSSGPVRPIEGSPRTIGGIAVWTPGVQGR
jgi:putative transposase